MSSPADRRRYDRHEIRLPAKVGPPGGPASGCLVLDYCSGGMLVKQKPAEAGATDCAYQTGQQLRMKTKLLSGRGMRTIAIGGTVAWVRGEHFGLSFDLASDAVVKALGMHDRLARGDEPRPAAPPAGGEARGLAKLREFAQGALPPLLRELLVQLGEDLLERMDSVVSDSERQQIYDDLSSIDGLRGGDSLTQAILSAAFDRNRPGRKEPDRDKEAGELSLVDPDDFERWLEASRVANLLDRRYGGRLSGIASRMAHLHDPALPGSLMVPFEPKHFTTPLKDLAREIELGSTARKALFDCADRLLGKGLGDFYDGIDEVLDGIGVPAAKQISRLNVPAAPRPASAGSGAGQEPAAGGKSGDAGNGATANPALTPSYIAAPGHGGATALEPALIERMVRRETEHREGLARELLGYVSEAPDMTESLEGWMRLLGTPLAREAAADHQFFQNKEHPLREIVDGLGHLQMFRATPDLDPINDPIRRQVSEILQPISQGETDPAELRGIAEALAELTGGQSRQYQRNVERVVEANEGRDRVRRARDEVSAEIRRRYADRRVPAVVPELLEVGWRAVLELAAINAVDGDRRYADQLGVLDSVVAQLGGDAFEPEASEPDAAQLFDRIEHELASVAFDPFRRNAVESRLRAELMDPANSKVQLVSMPAADGPTGDTAADARPDDISEREWERLLERCAGVTVGGRVRLLDENQANSELRVAWIREDREVFVLVDHRGLRVRDLRLAELAIGLHLQRIEVEDANGKPLSDRAVDSILVRMEDRLNHQAKHDSLTGLINRQQFNAALEQALVVPGRSEGAGVLLWLDIDQFRLVNDIRGYEVGDRLLAATARLLEQVKGAKVLGHLGGDRFALMLPDIDLSDGSRRAEEICALMREMPFDWAGQAISLSASVGVVPMGSARPEGFGHLLQAADDALAAAKAAGGDRSYVYNEDDPEIVRRKESMHWVMQVDEALDRGQLKLRCQPIVPVRPGGGLQPHYEVLLGVHSGSAEPLPIAEFIDAAERYNRMRAVDRWVTRTAMEWIAAHRAQMPMLHGFAVNLSGQTASDPSFVDFVRDQFQRTDIDPAWVSFEVTETAAISDLSSSAGIIQDLKSMGCKVALDDFGSGLASYSYLKELPVDWLKIDGVFVRKIATSREDLAVVKSINEIGHFLGKKTIAEYVADDKILRLIRAMGVDYAQGFGISPPLLMDDLLQTVEAATG